MKKLLLLMIMLFSTIHICGSVVSVVNLTSRQLLFEVVYGGDRVETRELPPREQSGYARIAMGARVLERFVVRDAGTGQELARYNFSSGSERIGNNFVEIREDGRQIIVGNFRGVGCISYAVNFAPFDIEVNFDFLSLNSSISCPGELKILKPYEVIRIVRSFGCRTDFVFARDKPHGMEISDDRFTKAVCEGVFLFLPVNGATHPTRGSIRIIDIF